MIFAKHYGTMALLNFVGHCDSMKYTTDDNFVCRTYRIFATTYRRCSRMVGRGTVQHLDAQSEHGM